MLELDYQAASFDVVLCVFGSSLSGHAGCSAGTVALCPTRRGKDLLLRVGDETLLSQPIACFGGKIGMRSELPKPSQPWDRIADPAGLRQMLREGGVEAEEVIAENRWHPIRSPEDWWTIVLGSGRRGAIEQLTPAEVTAVKEANLAFVRDHRITRLETNALHAIATKKSN